MPILSMRCVEGHEYKAIQSVSFEDPDLHRCPACGADSQRVFALPKITAKREKEMIDFHPLELEEHLEAKALYESAEFQAEMRQGTKGLDVRGPQCLRPRLERRFL